MSRTTCATPRCAARCAERIDLLPSRRIVAWAFAWLAMMCWGVFTASLPLAVRVVICLSFAPFYAACVRGGAQLRGRRAVRALGWTEEGALVAWFGSRATPLPATLAPGSFRLGTWMLVLTLQSETGRHAVLLDGAAQDPAAYRRLCQRLQWPPGRRSRRGRSPS